MLLRLTAWFLPRLYTTLAWAYDAVAALVSLGHWREWVHTALDDLSGPRVLELGHGPGHLLTALAERGVWACGLDASWPMSRQARKRGAGLRLIHGRAQALPFAEASFDQIVATFPTAFLFADDTVREIGRVLRPAGQAVVLLGAKTTVPWLQALYRLTGQETPPSSEALLTPFRQAGLHTRLAWKAAPRAKLLYLYVRKNPPVVQ